MENYFSGSNNSNNVSFGDDRTGLEESVQIKVLREYRTAKLPNGRISTIINGKVVDERELLWDGMTHMINHPQFNSYHGDAVEVRNAIQPQKSINRIESNWEEYVRTMCKGKILCHKSNNIKSSQFDSEHLEIIKYEGSGPKPEPWMPPPLPSDTANLIALKTAVMDDLFAEHMASQGKSPASASGAAINYLTEEDSRQHTPTLDDWRTGWERTDEKILDVIAGHSTPKKLNPMTGQMENTSGYDENRTITVLGEDRRADVSRFKPDMVAGKNRVYIISGGALPQNKTLRSEVARRLFDSGALGDPKQQSTRRKLLKMIDAGLVDDVYDDEALDEIRSEWENDQMVTGQKVAPRAEDDVSVHMHCHLHRMKSDDFLKYPPQVQQIFYDHMEVHGMQIAGAIPKPTMGNKPPAGPDSSGAVQNPVDMLKSAIQGSQPPPAPGAQAPQPEGEQ